MSNTGEKGNTFCLTADFFREEKNYNDVIKININVSLSKGDNNFVSIFLMLSA